MTQKWKDLIQAGDHTFNVSRWLARSTLDAIGEGESSHNAVFDIHSYNGPQRRSTIDLARLTVLRTPFLSPWKISCASRSTSILSRTSLTCTHSSDTLLDPSGVDLLFKGLWRYIPTSILQYVEYIPTKEYIRFRAFRKLAKSISKELIEEKASISMADSGSRDVMSVLGE